MRRRSASINHNPESIILLPCPLLPGSLVWFISYFCRRTFHLPKTSMHFSTKQNNQPHWFVHLHARGSLPARQSRILFCFGHKLNEIRGKMSLGIISVYTVHTAWEQFGIGFISDFNSMKTVVAGEMALRKKTLLHSSLWVVIWRVIGIK